MFTHTEFVGSHIALEHIIACTTTVGIQTIKLQIDCSRSYFGPSTGPEVIKLFSCSAQLRLKFILLINVKMPTIVGILTFMSRINY